MLILAVDTSTTSCSVALLENDRLMAEEIYSEGKTHSRHLIPIIRRLIDHCAVQAADLDGIAVSTGPGTFTGLRIGLSTVKGLASAAGVPVVGVSSLAALAYPLRGVEGCVVPLIDARRGEVYCALQGPKKDVFSKEFEIFVSSPETVMDKVAENSLLVGSGALSHRDVFVSGSRRYRFADPAFHVLRASSVGLLALERFQRFDVDSTETLAPEYVRPSDAQIQMSKRI